MIVESSWKELSEIMLDVCNKTYVDPASLVDTGCQCYLPNNHSGPHHSQWLDKIHTVEWY